MTISLRSLESGSVDISDSAIASLRGSLHGTALLAGDPGYDEARTVWNGMHDRRPGLVIRARDGDDIATAVRFARDNGLLLAIRAGGHQIAGHAVVDGAVMLDLSGMRAVQVDPQRRTARVEAGCLLADVDRETQAHGLAVPVGINSTTGIAGLTLGGGFGWITRKFGMTIDNLVSAEVVLADGSIVQASATEHPDLFWAIRGGGGNFGVVSSFAFALHPLGPQVMSGLVVHPIADAPTLLAAFRDICAEAPDELTVWTVMRKAPPLPFIPEEWHGREVLIFAACWAGDVEEGERALAGLRALGTPIADVISPHPFVGWQAAFDPLLAPGARNYWKSHDFLDLSDDVIRVVLDAVHDLPDPMTEVVLAHLGGAMARVPPDATAYPQRTAHFLINIHTRWADPAKDGACIGWARDLFDAAAPYAAGSVYVNFMPEDDAGRIAGAYGGNMERLGRVKARYDPANLFRTNHNIPVATALAAE